MYNLAHILLRVLQTIAADSLERKTAAENFLSMSTQCSMGSPFKNMMSIATVQLKTQFSEGILTLKPAGSRALCWLVSPALRIFSTDDRVLGVFSSGAALEMSTVSFSSPGCQKCLCSHRFLDFVKNTFCFQMTYKYPSFLWRLIHWEPSLPACTSAAKSKTDRSSVRTSGPIRSRTSTSTICDRICT